MMYILPAKHDYEPKSCNPECRLSPSSLATYHETVASVPWWSLGGNQLEEGCLHSLAIQARWLTRRLEVHLLGNHLFSNAKALIFAGLFFEGTEAEGWLCLGLKILEREVPEQILVDGGHFERSTMYQALALEDMLDLCNIAATFAPSVLVPWKETTSDWRRRGETMCEWLAAMSHPDGEISFFNDAAIDIAPSPQQLLSYAQALGLSAPTPSRSGLKQLFPSGYVRLAGGPIVALLDTALIGPDYLPGHAHADTLSFELSVFGQRVIVNSGTSCYEVSAERLRQRGTAAHSTVLVDGENSSEVWASFRVARRARPVELDLVPDGRIRVRCGHDGYRRLRGKPSHVREWRLDEDSLIVEDTVTGAFSGAEARFHLHPSVSVQRKQGGLSGHLMLNDGRCLKWLVEVGTLKLAPSTYHPRFGVSESNLCLVLSLKDGNGRIRFEWA